MYANAIVRTTAPTTGDHSFTHLGTTDLHFGPRATWVRGTRSPPIVAEVEDMPKWSQYTLKQHEFSLICGSYSIAGLSRKSCCQS